MPGNKVTNKQLPPLRLQPLRPENKYMYKESLTDVKDFNSLTASKQEPAVALCIAEIRQAEQDERRKVYKLREAFLRGDNVSKVDADEALAKRRAMAEALVRRKERALESIEEKTAKDVAKRQLNVALRQAELKEAKTYLQGEKRFAADSLKLAKDELKKAKADAKRTKPSFITRLRSTFVEKPKEMLREEGRKKRGGKK